MHDASRAARQALYNTTRWRKLRLRHLADHPLCVYCQRRGVTAVATVVDHVQPHRGDHARFYDAANLQSLCASCHNHDKSREEHGRAARVAFDATGAPRDPRHSHARSPGITSSHRVSRAREGAAVFIGGNPSDIDMGLVCAPPPVFGERLPGVVARAARETVR